MIKHTLQNGLKVFDISKKVCDRIFSEAQESSLKSFPKSGKVGSAVVTSLGNYYQGANYYSDVYTLTMHAEATALAHAVIHGEREIIAINGPCCHICKQLLWENSVRTGIDIIIVTKVDNVYKKTKLSDLMPMAWPENPYLKK